MKLSAPPTIIATDIIITAAFSISLNPNSLNKTMKVAKQGKYMARITQPIVSCFNVKPIGPNIPTATSFLKNPTNNADIASDGRPQIFLSSGEKMRAKKSTTPKA